MWSMSVFIWVSSCYLDLKRRVHSVHNLALARSDLWSTHVCPPCWNQPYVSRCEEGNISNVASTISHHGLPIRFRIVMRLIWSRLLVNLVGFLLFSNSLWHEFNVDIVSVISAHHVCQRMCMGLYCACVGGGVWCQFVGVCSVESK